LGDDILLQITGDQITELERTRLLDLSCKGEKDRMITPVCHQKKNDIYENLLEIRNVFVAGRL
jgi:hypothetical protein